MAEPVPHGHVLLAARGLTKRFGHVVANDDVTFEVRSGEIQGLVGENGSGKTTLCKLLTGLYSPDAGYVEVAGQPLELRAPRDALEAGIFMVHQHFSLVERLSVAENVVLGWTRRRSRTLARRSVESEVADLSTRLGVPVDPKAPVWRLSMGERQRVEILKALYRDARVLILDEPTTVLTPQEADALTTTLRGLADAGTGIVFISHKLKEVLAACERITVLRAGHVTAEVDCRAETPDVRELVRSMVGRNVELRRRPAQAHDGEQLVALEIDAVSIEDDRGLPAVQNASLTVHAGEIVGVAGVAGNGQRELVEAIAGLRPVTNGEIRVGGRAVHRGAVDRALAYVPEDRFGVGLAPHLSVAENLILKDFASQPYASRSLLRPREIEAAAARMIDTFSIRATPSIAVVNLSGGNAQKVVLARELSSTPAVLVAACPTRGLDVGAIEQVREILAEVASQGAAVLLVSEDLDELMDLSDRIAVVYDGRIVGVDERDATDVDRIGLMMVGIAE